MSLYRIFYSDGNDRDELGRVTAKDIDQAIEYTLKQYFKPDLEYSEDGDEDHLILNINSCKYCDKKELMEINDIEDETELCDNCETSECIEIEKDNDSDPEYKTIYGVNEYANLETDTRPAEFNPLLAKAWRIDPQLGCDTLMYTTINDNPKLCETLDPEYLHKVNESAEKVRSTK